MYLRYPFQASSNSFLPISKRLHPLAPPSNPPSSSPPLRTPSLPSHAEKNSGGGYRTPPSFSPSISLFFSPSLPPPLPSLPRSRSHKALPPSISHPSFRKKYYEVLFLVLGLLGGIISRYVVPTDHSRSTSYPVDAILSVEDALPALYICM